MGTHYDPTKPRNYIFNLDGKNLDGKPMSYTMPHSGFICLIEEQWSKIHWLAQREDQYTGYFVECVLEYPPELHDSKNDYPLAPETVAVRSSVLSDKQV